MTRIVPSTIGLSRNAKGESVIELQTFLQKFGYLKLIQNEVDVTARNTSIPVASKGDFDANTEIALQNYQKFYGLPQSGELDEDTIKHMALPRCGCPDNPQGLLASFTAQGNKWDKTSLTYRFVNFTADLSEAEVRNAIATALGLWSAVTPLTFTEVTSDNNADILIRFATGDHGDGEPFDGVGNTLAHAFYPPPTGGDIAGDAHFDDSETWSVNLPASGTDLVTVAAHEFGHSLGLDHSTVEGSLMYAYYNGAHRFLHEDDIKGIQSIYGKVLTRDPVTVVSRNPNQLDIFITGNDGGVWTNWWNPNDSWWTQDRLGRIPGGPFNMTTPISAVSRTTDQLDIFAIGNDGGVWTNWWNPNDSWWTQDRWGRIPGGPFSMGTPVTAISRKRDQLDIFVIGNDGGVWTNSWNPTDSWWAQDKWARIPGGPFSMGTSVTAVSRNPDQIDIFVIGNDGGIWTNWWNPTDSWFTQDRWGRIPGGPFSMETPVTAVSRNLNQLDIFAIGNDGGIWTNWWNPNDSWWTQDRWGRIPGGPFSKKTPVTAVSRTTDQLDIFAIGNDGGVWTNWWNPNDSWWTQDRWGRIPGGPFDMNVPITAVSRTTNQLDIFAIGNDGGIWTNWWNPNDSWWTQDRWGRVSHV